MEVYESRSERGTAHCDFGRVATERGDVCVDPLQREPLILEPEVPVDLGLVARKEAKRRQTVPDVHPNLVTFGCDVLGLRLQPVR